MPRSATMSGHVLRDLRAALGDEQPADVRVEQVLRRCDEAIAGARVRAMRVALDVRELMVLAVVGHPGEHRPSTAIDPRIANVQRTHCFVWNARCVNSRW